MMNMNNSDSQPDRQPIPLRTANPVVFPWILLPLTLLGFAMEIPDPIFTKNLMDIVLDDSTKYFGMTGSMLIAFSLYCFAVAIPIAIGIISAREQNMLVAQGKTDKKTMIVKLGICAVWVSVGLGMFLLRWFQNVIGADNWVLWHPWADLPIALLMLFLYFGGGLDLMHQSNSYFTSNWHVVGSVERKTGRVEQAASRAESRAQESMLAVRANWADDERFMQEARGLRTSNECGINKMKHTVRHRLIAYLANPAQTSGPAQAVLLPAQHSQEREEGDHNE